MKKSSLFLFLLAIAMGSFAQNIRIEITNPFPFDRVNEMIEIRAAQLGTLTPGRFVIMDQDNKEVPYQLIYNGTTTIQSLIFPINVKTGTRETYTLRAGRPAPVTPLTSARFVPERRDDFAWENNIAAYRMFGPALAPNNPSNGVDLWLKRTEELVVDSFYRNELVHGKSYHIDHGQGLDCYIVGNSLGAGGVAPYTDTTLWIGKHFDRYRVIETGPLRSVFRLYYDSVKVKGKLYQKQITITTNAHSVLNRAVVKLTGPSQKMQLATGIFLHDGKGNLQRSAGMIVYGERAVTETGVDMGQNWVAVLLPARETAYKIQDLHALLLTDYVPGNEFTYFFGGGWSQWKFPTQQDWLAAVQHFNRTNRHPVTINIVR